MRRPPQDGEQAKPSQKKEPAGLGGKHRSAPEGDCTPACRIRKILIAAEGSPVNRMHESPPDRHSSPAQLSVDAKLASHCLGCGRSSLTIFPVQTHAMKVGVARGMYAITRKPVVRIELIVMQRDLTGKTLTIPTLMASANS